MPGYWIARQSAEDRAALAELTSDQASNVRPDYIGIS